MTHASQFVDTFLNRAVNTASRDRDYHHVYLKYKEARAPSCTCSLSVFPNHLALYTNTQRPVFLRHSLPLILNSFASIPTMQTSLSKDNIASSYDTISPMTLWEMTRLPADDQTFGSGPGPSTMGHARSISSESMSSSSAYGQQNALSRNHPSLNYRTGIDPGLYLSPNSAEQGTSYVTMAMKRDSPPRSHLPSRWRGASPRSDDEDELVDEPLDPNASAQDRQAYKRCWNTLAARRS